MDTVAAKRRPGDIFVERGLITSEQLGEALSEQGANGGKLGEILVEKGFVTRVALAGVIGEQWDAARVTAARRKNGETTASAGAAAGSSVVEFALRERLEALTSDLAARNQRIDQQGATIDVLLQRIAELEAARPTP